ncbi:MAG TPA: energy transducer TonB [Stellaceae bacterium]|nr:energy transducer TonB [Stellaceae bacterium]
MLKAALPLSAAGHFAIVALLLLLPAAVPAPPRIDLSNAVEVVFAMPAPAPAPPPPRPAAEQPPPPLPIEPPPPLASVGETPPPAPRKPEPKPVPKPRPRPVKPVEQPMPQLPLPTQSTQSAAPAPASQVAAVPRLPPAPSPGPTISPDYRTVLSGWLEAHKRYPDDARQRGEQGRAVLRFRVDRYGRVIDYAVVSSTGFADLDAAVENMMRGATMPPFPASMTEPEIEVSVTIRFGLSR